MQRKHMIAAILAVAALGMIFICVNADEYSADGSDTVTYHVNVTNTERSINLILNENYFQSIDSKHRISWNYSNGTDYVNLELGTTYTYNDCEFKLTKKGDGSIGEYILTMKATTTDVKTIVLKLRCSITINISDKTGGDREYVTDHLYIAVNVSMNNGNDLPSGLSYHISTDTAGRLTPIDGLQISEGTPVSLTPSLNGTDKKAGELIWYAYNLPKGLAMTSSGVITGVPVEHNYTPSDSKVYVEDWYGNGKTFTLKFVILEANFDVSYYVTDEEFTGTTDMSGLVHEPSQYMTQRGKTVTLVAAKEVKVSVVSVNDDIERKAVEYSATVQNGPTTWYCYTLPTDGTGMYRVIVSDKNTDVKLSAFDLYVMSRLLAVQSEIIVGSDGSS